MDRCLSPLIIVVCGNSSILTTTVPSTANVCGHICHCFLEPIHWPGMLATIFDHRLAFTPFSLKEITCNQHL